MRILLLGLLTSMMLLPTVKAQQRLALVMGNKDYSLISQLKNPLNDADAIAKKLRKLGFDVVVLKKNLNRKKMKTAVRSFSDKIAAGDIALFYYAGHGVQSSKGKNYLIPLKADIKREADLEEEAITANWVLAHLNAGKPVLKIMILDACRDNPFRGFRSSSRGLARMDSNGGTIIAYAAGEGQKAQDGYGDNGLYTEELLKWLSKSGIQASQMFSSVSWKVSENPDAAGQTPFLSLQAPPPFCFAGCSQNQANSNNSSNSGNAIIDKPKLPQRLAYEPEMKFIKGGRFQMGSPANEKNRSSDEKQHSVQVGDFWMAKTETTFKQWQACVDDGGCQFNKKPDDRGWGRGNRPVIKVSWHDANEYAKWLSKQTGKDYHLPTEAQWEYAARGGTSTAFSFGNRISTIQANFNGHYTYNGSSKGHYLDKTARVGSYPANRYGLQDMHGNVYEWTCSAYDENYGGSEENQCVKRNDNRYRVLRGGSWLNRPRDVRSASRNDNSASLRDDGVGFRLSRTH